MTNYFSSRSVCDLRAVTTTKTEFIQITGKQPAWCCCSRETTIEGFHQPREILQRKMRLPTEVNDAGPTEDVVPVDLDALIGKLKENLTMKSCCREKVERRHNVRPSPYCIPRKTSTTLPTRTSLPSGAAENLYTAQGFIKCSKCFQRHCKCSYTEGSSIMILKQLLREQTLIQEAVRRLQNGTDGNGEHLLCRPCSPEDESEWHSEGFTTRHTSYESEIGTPLESDIDS